MQDHGSHTLFVIGQCGFGATCRQVPQSYCAVMTSRHNLATEEKTPQIRAKRKMCPSRIVLLQTQNNFSSFHSYLAYLLNLHNRIPPTYSAICTGILQTYITPSRTHTQPLHLNNMALKCNIKITKEVKQHANLCVKQSRLHCCNPQSYCVQP